MTNEIKVFIVGGYGVFGGRLVELLLISPAPAQTVTRTHNTLLDTLLDTLLGQCAN